MTGLLGEFSELVYGGSAVALAAVVLLQYLVHMNRVGRLRRNELTIKEDLAGLESELGEAKKDRSLTRLENHILREFVSQTDLAKALDVLLRRFVPRTENGYAALIEKGSNGFSCHWSRGLTSFSQARLTLTDDLFDQICTEGVEPVTRGDAAFDEFVDHLDRPDKAKAETLYFVVVGTPADPVGVFVTTKLYPAGAPLPQQIELAQRLMLNVAAGLRQTRTLESQQRELRAITEMMELRTVTDRTYDSPVRMITAFSERLREKVGADRATLYLPPLGKTASCKALMRCGSELPEGLDRVWIEHEDRIARFCLGMDEPRTLAPETLKKFGIHTLIRHALVFPLRQGEKRLGMICLTKGGQESFETTAQQLGEWASEYLGETIFKVVNQAIVERQARQDGLTELANRREFDQQLNAHVAEMQTCGTDVSLLLCDLDRFKAVNDTYGHQSGDEVLRVAAQVVREQVMSIRSTDRAVIARYGGEEIAVILPGVPLPGAVRVGESIRKAISEIAFEFERKSVTVTTSVGVASLPMHGETAVDLIARADEALYHAKQSGRNRVCTFGDVSAVDAAAKEPQLR
ncbi:GGDEF domain-containing protein [Stratiformator vulcanicus]|nr:GGDEF domain-containing protein [Stratiformator vulcanicus]